MHDAVTLPPPPPLERPRSREDRLWIIPLACLLTAILLSLLAFWALSTPYGPGTADTPGASHIRERETGSTPTGNGPGAGAAGEGAGAAAAAPEARSGAPGGNTAAPTSVGSATDSLPTTASDERHFVDLAPVAPAEELGFATAVTSSAPPAPAIAGEPAESGRAGGPSFFGQVGRGTRFVYVIDRSGSMQGERFDAARFELIKSIRSLRPHESFSVIFFDTAPLPLPMPGLLPARQQAQQAAIDWVRTVSVGGGTDPTEAMEIALKQLKPHTIWLLTDGAFDVRVTDAIRDANPEAQVQINTICFHDSSGESLLKRIARENDGDYRFVGP